MKISLKLLLVLVLFGCQNTVDDPFIHQMVNSQKFTIQIEKDTSLLSKEGVKISIEANTFDSSKSKEIELAFSTIMNKTDMVLNKVYSVDKNGGFLETAGMFQLRDLTNNTQVFRKPIQLEIPTSIANSNMSEYAANETGGLMTWTKTEKKIELKNTQSLEIGEELFKLNCSSCHSQNLRTTLTGPPLGNVTLNRGKEWLIQFTKNSMQMISAGDSIAVCVYQQYNKSVMTGFEHLSDSAIASIYEYIANESRVQGIGINEIDYLSECEIDTTRSISNFTFPNYAYVLSLESAKWVNIDFLNNYKEKIDPIIITTDKEYEDITIAMVFKNSNTVIPFIFNENQFHLLFAKGKYQINFPLGEQVVIIANTPDFQYKIIEYKPTQKGNRIELTLDKKGKATFLDEVRKI